MSPDRAVDRRHLCAWKPESVDSWCLAEELRTNEELCGLQGKPLQAVLLKRGDQRSKRSVGAALWGGETYQLVDRQGKDTEHEMAGDLRVSPDADMAPAELVLEAGVGPLDTGTDPETHAPGVDMARRTPGPGLPVQLLLEFLVPARVDVDDRNMAKAFACLVDLPGVIGRGP